MTKLEQCIRLAHAMDTASSVETRYAEDPSPAFNTPMYFATVLRNPDGDQNLDHLAQGEGETLEQAIETLHVDLRRAARRMRVATDLFDVAAEEAAP